MAFLNITSAAKAVGKDRSTIHRYMKDGRLSGVIDDTGHIRIETSELLRVFGELKNNCGIPVARETADSKDDAATLRRLLLESQGREEWLRAQLEAEKMEREREREHSRELEKRILALPGAVVKKPGFLSRLFGK